MAIVNHSDSTSPLEQSIGKPLPAFCEDLGTPTGLSSANSSFRRGSTDSSASRSGSPNNNILAASGFAKPLPLSGSFRKMGGSRRGSFRTPFGTNQSNSILRNMSVSRPLACPYGAGHDTHFGPMVEEEVDSYDHESVIVVEPPTVVEEQHKWKGTKPIYRAYMRATSSTSHKKRDRFSAGDVDVHSNPSSRGSFKVKDKDAQWRGSGSPRPITPRSDSASASSSRSGSRTGSWVQQGSTWVQKAAASRYATARSGSVSDRLYKTSTAASRSASVTSIPDAAPTTSRSSSTANLRSASVPNSRGGSFFQKTGF